MKKYTLTLLFLLVAWLLPAQVSGQRHHIRTRRSVTVDYGATLNTGHPEVFGGKSWPIDSAKSQELLDAGVTVCIGYLRLARLVPPTSNAEYRAGIGVPGSVADPDTWDWTGQDEQKSLNFAKSIGIKLNLMIRDVAGWNSYTGTAQGVPNDWDVYEDIVKKVYQHLLPDEVEIWNEPDYSMKIAGSPYDDTVSAYIDLYYHAAHAIRTVSSSVPIGGPNFCCSGADQWVGPFLTSPTIPANYINFLAYHNYNDGNSEAPNGIDVVRLTHQYRPGLPVYLGEWNAGSACGTTPLDDNDPGTVAFAGMRLVNAIRAGISEAGYWALFFDRTCSFFTRGLEDPLLPKARTWLLMSQKLGLGAGVFSVKASSGSSVTTTLGAINSTGQRVAVVVNNNSQPQAVSVMLRNTGLVTPAVVNVYTADSSDDPSVPTLTQPQTVANGTVTLIVNLPAYSVVGLMLSPGREGE